MTKKDTKAIFAKNLNMYMDLNNKTRKDLCDQLGFSYFTVSDWVNAKKYPRMDRVEELARYFGVKVSDLVEEKVTDDMQTKNDTAVDIVLRLGRDHDFAELVKKIYKLDSDQIQSVSNLLDSFLK